MPNWCVGDLKVRGTKDNIERFLLEGLLPVGWSILSPTEQPKVNKDDYSITISLDKNSFYLKGTHRQFIEQSSIEFYYPDEEEKTTVLVLEEYSGAWAIDSIGLAKLSKEFNIDFKIYGFERGMCFNQDIEIISGKIVKDDEIKFDDYDWECISPQKGG